MLRLFFITLLSLPLLANGQPADGEPLFDDEGLPRVVVPPGVQKRGRIAVPNIRCAGTAAVCDGVSGQVRHLLELSTFFEILDAKTFVANMDAETLNKTSWSDWFNVGARYLVKGKLSGKGPYELELRLYSVVDKVRVPVEGESHKGLDKAAVRTAVNAFVNGVIKKLSGQPGIFGTRIVYAIKTSAQTRGIAIMDMDGHGQHGLYGGDSIAMLPKFAPGGVLYTKFLDGVPQLYVGRKRLTHDSYAYRGAAYSSSGRLAASLSKGGGSDIYILGSGGKIQSRLTHGQGQNVSPSWSPDGSRIAFVSDRAGGPQVYIMGSGGGGATRLTMAGSYNSTPHWGKSGLIAFAGMNGNTSDIFTVSPGGAMSRITQDQGRNTDPCWSPDGRYLAFVSRRAGHGKRIWISSADGRWQFPVSKRSGGYSTPRWGL